MKDTTAMNVRLYLYIYEYIYKQLSVKQLSAWLPTSVSADVWDTGGNVWDWSVALVEGKEWSVCGVSRGLCDVAVDRICSLTVI